MDDEPTAAQWQAATLKAARHDRWLERHWALFLLLAAIVFGVPAYLILKESASNRCYDAAQLTPEWSGTDGTGQPTTVFKVPENSWAVVRMDGSYKDLGPGKNFLNNQGIVICKTEQDAMMRAATLNKQENSSP